MFARLKSSIREQDFNPGKLGLLVNPFYFARKALRQQIKSLARHISGRVLDVGCGSKPYESLLNCSEYVGMEIDTPENREKKIADLLYTGGAFPIEDSSFDWVVSTEVFEHVFNPDVFLSEIARVLKPSGGLLLTVPFIWDEHEQPFDYARYTSFGLRYLLESHGFEIIELRKSVDDIRVIFQMINAYLYKKVISENRPIRNSMLILLLMAPFNLTGALLAKLMPSNSDLYLDNIILARKA
jgi:SAM-dependent methyltransferase